VSEKKDWTFTDDFLWHTLIHAQVPFGMWGKGETKTVQDLADEIRKKESYLLINNKGVFRVTGIVRLRVSNPSLGFLKEKQQTLPDGRIRERDLFPGGKIMGDENYETAAFRELEEELGITADDLRSWTKAEFLIEEHNSRSYPGLPCILEIHVFDMIVKDHNRITLDQVYKRREDDGTEHIFVWSNWTN
jgi:8-oxo-dGTP pyrophosphatase MutT (NUDIX family)